MPISVKRRAKKFGLYLFSLPLILIFQNCADQKMGFSEAVAEYSAITDGTCTEAGVTQAKILTSSVKNGQSNNYIDYEIAHSDCEGFALVLDKGSILFDVNAYVTQALSLDYSIDDGTNTYSGTMAPVKGKDMFGNVSSNYFYFSTQNVNFSSNTKKLKLRIFLKGQIFSKNSDGAAASEEKIETYLAFGTAAPVEKVVKFIK